MNLKRIAAYLLSIAMIGSSFGSGVFQTVSKVSADETAGTEILLKAELIYETDNGTVTVTGAGNLSDAQQIVIPDEIGGCPITSVADRAFYGCKNVESIILGKNLVSIGSEAFYGSPVISSVTIPESVENIGEYAFGYTTKCMIPPGRMTMFDQPVINNDFTVYGCTSAAQDYVNKSMEDNVFSETIKMHYVNIKSDTDYTGKVQKITDTASCVVDENGVLTVSGTGSLAYGSKPWLAYSEEVSEIVIENGITDIPENTFDTCINTQTVVMPDSVDEIGDYAFRGFTKLKSVTMPESLSSLGKGVFYGCSSLETVSIPDGITEIPDNLLYGCKALIAADIPEQAASIGQAAFYGCESLASVSIPEGITDIRDQTFMNCSALTSVQLPETLIYIGDESFRNCASLKKADFPDKLISLGREAFMGCTGLENISLPDSFKVLDRGVFAGCENLSLESLPASLKIIFNDCFDTSASVPDIPQNVMVLDKDGMLISEESQAELSFEEKDGTLIVSGNGVIPAGQITVPDDIDITMIKKLVIADGITGISKDNFKNAEFTNLESIEISDSVRYIGPSAFENDNGTQKLVSVKLGSGVLYTGQKSFSFNHQPRIINFVLPQGLVYIDDCSFMYVNKSIMIGTLYCDNIDIPGSVCVIGDYAVGYQYNSIRSEMNDRYLRYTRSLSSAPQSMTEFYSKYSHFAFNPVNSDGSVTDILGKYEYGDIDMDSEVDMSDLTLLSQYLVGDLALTDDQMKLADVICDSDVSISDLAHLKQFIMHENVKLGVIR